jgi:hypothetical protein
MQPFAAPCINGSKANFTDLRLPCAELVHGFMSTSNLFMEISGGEAKSSLNLRMVC